MNKNYDLLRKEATKLRLTGKSYGEIKNILGVSKSTLSYWLKFTPLSEAQQKKLYTKQIKILSRGRPSQTERRKREIEDIINKSINEVGLPVSEDVLKMMGVALYWAEGSKGQGGLEITNSDPFLILFFIKWVDKMFGIKAMNLTARLNLYQQQNEEDIKNFWSELTGIPIKQFGKSYIKPASTGYKKNNLYFGTMRIEVPKSTDLKHRVFGWLKAVLSEDELMVNSTLKRWEKISRLTRPINL